MQKSESLDLVGFSNVDWAGSSDDRRSTGACCVFPKNSLILWNSNKQKVVSCSNIESEYRALPLATTELI